MSVLLTSRHKCQHGRRVIVQQDVKMWLVQNLVDLNSYADLLVGRSFSHVSLYFFLCLEKQFINPSLLDWGGGRGGDTRNALPEFGINWKALVWNFVAWHEKCVNSPVNVLFTLKFLYALHTNIIRIFTLPAISRCIFIRITFACFFNRCTIYNTKAYSVAKCTIFCSCMIVNLSIHLQHGGVEYRATMRGLKIGNRKQENTNFIFDSVNLYCIYLKGTLCILEWA